MPKKPVVGPGQKVPDSGIYRSGDQRATLIKGKKAPPTLEKQQPWRQEVDTNPGDASSKKNRK